MGYFISKAMKKKSLLCAYMTMTFIELFAQVKHDHIWLFGSHDFGLDSIWGGSKIDFNLAPPSVTEVELPDNFNFDETSMISDSNGSFIAATDGCSIINNAFQHMIDGDSLNPGEQYDSFCPVGGYPTSQGSIMLPKPDASHLYYLFHLAFDGNFFLAQLYFTEIDAYQNNGLGGILQKNQLILDTLHFGEQMTACRHANGRDWWLVLPYGTVQQPTANRYFKFLFSPTGISGPFRQDIGDGWGLQYWSGQATFSPDGTKYARLNPSQGMRLFNFDRCTGEFFNPRAFYYPNDTLTACGVAFSPNSRFLYASFGDKVVQYDTEAADIEASRVTVAVYDGFMSPLWTNFYQQMLAPDGKIYITASNSVNVLHIIHNPNEKGLDCELEQHGFQLPKLHDWSIPNFPHFRLYGQSGSPCDTLGLSHITEQPAGGQSQVKVHPNPASGEVAVSLPVPLRKVATWTLFDQLGRAVRQAVLSPGQQEAQVSVESLPPGLYFWKVESESRQIGDGKLIVVK